MIRRGIQTMAFVGVLLLAGCSGAAPDTEEPEGARPAATTSAATEQTTGSDGEDGTATDETRGAETHGAEPDGAEDTEDALSDGSDPTDQETRTAAPPDGDTVIEVGPGAAFLSPSSNIACLLAENEAGEGYAACDIGETDTPIELPPNDHVPKEWLETVCEEPVDQGSTLLLAQGEVFWNCSHEPIMIAADVQYGGSWVGHGPTAELWDGTEAAVLAYGQTLRTSTHECISAQDGVTCQEIGGEHGLTLSRGGLDTW